MACPPKRAAIFAAVSALFGGCKPLAQVSRAAYIIGPTSHIVALDDTQAAKVSSGAINAAVLIATGLSDGTVKFCSGTLIAAAAGESNLRVLTNHHCFAKSENSDGTAAPDLLDDACTGTKVYLGFRPDHTSSATTTHCQSGSLHTNYEGDLAVFTLADSVPAQYQPLELWDGDVPTGTKAFIVHYPDISNNFATAPGESVQLPTASLTVDNCSVLGLFSPDEWDLDRTLPYSIKHTCDLVHGSSGSGLIDLATNKILGVDWGGIKITNNGVTDTTNVATSAAFVQAFLAGTTAKLEADMASEKASSDAHAATATTSRDGAKKSFAKTLCGTIGASNGAPASATLWLLVAPVLLALL